MKRRKFENLPKGFVFTVFGARRGKRENCTKGFVFTVDAMVGAAIIAFVILSFTFTVQQPSADNLVLERIAIDTLAILEERGTLDSRSLTSINTTVRELLPSYLQYTFTIDYYNITETGGLTFDRTLHTTIIQGDKDIVYATRPVPILVNESTSSHIKNTTALAKTRLGVTL